MIKTKSIWFNGLSGAGKSTLALELKRRLISSGFKVILLDGDILRKGINKDLGFSDADRFENIRRVAEINLLFILEGYLVINAFIAPTQKIRASIAQIIDSKDLFEIALNTPLYTCMQRDVKGLYQKVNIGVIHNMTGINEVFEPSVTANITIDTTNRTIEDCIEEIFKILIKP